MDEESNNKIKLPEEFIDALREVGNIGSGHAANALADILNRRVDMSLPKLNIFSLDQLSTMNWGNTNKIDPYAFILIETKGDFQFIILVIFDKTTLINVLSLVSGDIGFLQDMRLDELSNFDKSTITEIGSILGLHYLTAIGEFLGLTFEEGMKISIGTPQLLIENSETVLTSLAGRSDTDFVHMISIECDIFTNDNILHPSVVLIPDESTIQKSLKLMFGE